MLHNIWTFSSGSHTAMHPYKNLIVEVILVCPLNVAYVLCTHTYPLNGPLSWTTQVSRYQKGKTNLDFTET